MCHLVGYVYNPGMNIDIGAQLVQNTFRDFSLARLEREGFAYEELVR